MSVDATGMLTPHAIAEITCTVCGAPPGEECILDKWDDEDDVEWDTHITRLEDYREGVPTRRLPLPLKEEPVLEPREDDELERFAIRVCSALQTLVDRRIRMTKDNGNGFLEVENALYAVAMTNSFEVFDDPKVQEALAALKKRLK